MKKLLSQGLEMICQKGVIKCNSLEVTHYFRLGSYNIGTDTITDKAGREVNVLTWWRDSK